MFSTLPKTEVIILKIVDLLSAYAFNLAEAKIFSFG